MKMRFLQSFTDNVEEERPASAITSPPFFTHTEIITENQKMANKHHHAPSSLSRSRSQIFLFALGLFTFFLLFFLFSFIPHSSLPNPNPNFTLKPETSFVKSLNDFLDRKSSSLVSDDTVRTVNDDDVRELDQRFGERVYSDPYYPVEFPIRVFVYEMPRKFTYDLLWLFRDSYGQTDNLTSNGSPVHRLIEQHSIDYWLWVDLIAPEKERMLKSVVRVERQEDADLFYVPFFTTISFFLLEKQQCKALYRV